jgi:BlaI family transcriptional regulator, penicillinase repressor
MFNRSKSRKPLSELEHLVMNLVWSRKSVTAEQVREALAVRRPMKESTVRTILRRLEQKGYVRHRVEGRTYIYTGCEAPQSVAARSVRSIIERFCGGSVEELLVGMVDHDVVDQHELERLGRKIARRRDTNQGG